ncbi:hypothetical protein A6U87_16135 [Rhizobium sp. AC44/96]|uniref:hypothetical protein n=1 Tax=unclassified Rhizobium TaxID=2613769 RepID=UPI00080FCDDD|nr:MULTISPECIES: hypothetical protein [unclassified Rhizobium]MDM9618828.1 hypothetical protein [Rhizobium sp. S96]OCJ04363.1 hypothetical protein A6U87_16135 [Rhizobium sp. AC44/96]
MVDLATFAPKSAQELGEGLLTVAAAKAKEQWDKIRQEMTAQLSFIAQMTTKVIAQLAAKEITAQRADVTLHLLEYNLNSALAEFKFLVYNAAQKILSAVFDLIKAAVKNLTGISLLF